MVNLHINNYKLTPFNIAAKDLMQGYLAQIQSELSDYTFAQNFIWLSHSSGFYTIVNETFCLFILNGEDLTMLLPPLGKLENINTALVECFSIMNSHNSSIYVSRIEYVHQSFVENFIASLDESAEIYELMQDYIVEKKLVDYVYMSDHLIELKGNSYHTKRIEINKFKKSYKDISIEILDPNRHKDEVLSILNRWIEHRFKYIPKEQSELFIDGISHERFAIKRILKYYDELDLIGVVLYINGTVAGFSVGERLNETSASILIEKSDFEILGAAQFIFREFCKVLKEKFGSTYINVGDDMGFENLKKVKLSYRPYKLIPKYTIYQK